MYVCMDVCMYCPWLLIFLHSLLFLILISLKLGLYFLFYSNLLLFFIYSFFLPFLSVSLLSLCMVVVSVLLWFFILDFGDVFSLCFNFFSFLFLLFSLLLVCTRLTYIVFVVRLGFFYVDFFLLLPFVLIMV